MISSKKQDAPHNNCKSFVLLKMEKIKLVLAEHGIVSDPKFQTIMDVPNIHFNAPIMNSQQDNGPIHKSQEVYPM